MKNFLLVARVALITISVVLAGQFAYANKKTENVNLINQRIDLIWNATRDDFKNRQKVDFIYDGIGEFNDGDCHPITTPAHWNAMKAPTPDAVACVEVFKGTTIPQVQAAIKEIAKKGGYKTVVIVCP